MTRAENPQLGINEGGCEIEYFRSMQKKLKDGGFWANLPDAY
jgi:hypothetical protein